MAELHRVLKPGLTRLNWTSLGISDFIQKCNQEINKFSSLVNQVRKNSANVSHVVDQIARATIIKAPPENEVLDIFEFIEMCNRHKTMIVDGLVQKYLTISPLLIKIESLVANTNTGKSPQLKTYYMYWEKRILTH
ncbi:Dynein heavy chain 10, axonemal [Coelomomyces lativittatus]|nr:Dynein heavy chain 10, axonemal [Coelomomyces lativittatus]